MAFVYKVYLNMLNAGSINQKEEVSIEKYEVID